MSSADTLFSEASSTVDPRAAAALHRLERAVAGEQVPPAMTNLDKTVDWYAAHLREQIRDYLSLAAEDLTRQACNRHVIGIRRDPSGRLPIGM